MVHVRRSWSSLLLLAVALSACESSSDGALDVTSSPVSDAAVAGDLPPAGADVLGEVADVPPPSDLGSSDVVASDMSVAPETSPADSGPGPDVGEPGPIESGYTGSSFEGLIDRAADHKVFGSCYPLKERLNAPFMDPAAIGIHRDDLPVL